MLITDSSRSAALYIRAHSLLIDFKHDLRGCNYTGVLQQINA